MLLHDLELLDSPREAEFNDLVNLASELCGTPISLLTLLDSDRQWFKAAKGISIQETERSLAFCDKALLQDDMLVVPDATLDPRFSSNPYVLGDPHVRFYAGALIHSPDGHKLGTLCIIDSRPRELNWKEANILSKLAKQATSLIELRQRRREAATLEVSLAAAESDKAALREQFSRLAHLAELQAANMAAYLDNGMDNLNTGKFTKRDIGDIVSKAAEHRAQIENFRGVLAQLAAYRAGTAGIAEPIHILQLVQELFPRFGPLVKSSGNKVTPLIAADIVLRQDPEAVRLILSVLLGSLLGALTGADIRLLARGQEEGVYFELQIPDHNLVDALQRFMPDQIKLGAEHLSGRPFHVELALVKDLVIELGGRKELHALGNRGTAIELFLPHR
ncbi:MAG: GAF domain-containing protein [Chitinophagaceae bacterium]|nr:MAG: GAF domain-containing protein [Chitinophagaceae bacterium]